MDYPNSALPHDIPTVCYHRLNSIPCGSKAHEEDVAEALLQQLQGTQHPREVLGFAVEWELHRRQGLFSSYST